MRDRSAGVLLHPTSLPSPLGIGTFDGAAYEFLDFLHAARMRYWQICPLGPTGYGDSPYQCFSVFAGNPFLIDLAPLVGLGLIPASALDPLRGLPPDRVDFPALHRLKLPLLFSAHAAWRRQPGQALPYGGFAEFRREQGHWLEGYALYSALRDHFDSRPWWEWPAEVRSWQAARTSPLVGHVGERAEAYAFLQYLFFGQWHRLRQRARELGVGIIGDAPIFTAPDSADVWANPQLFQLDPVTQRPTAVAGVPPDYFSADGQHWGNPLYAWTAHAAEGYAWWLARLRINFDLADVVRLDHFRGFDTYWSIPAGAPTARSGHWEIGPGLAFFAEVKQRLPDAKIIAEDLGDPAASVVELREATGLPGMAVLQFAFGSGSDNLYLPHHHQPNQVVYPGTHDNDTTRSWYDHADEQARDQVRRYLRVSGQEVSWDFIRSAYASVARLAVLPLQDLLDLGGGGRFNRPGTTEGNWSWRYQPHQLQQLRNQAAPYLAELATLFDRTPEPRARP